MGASVLWASLGRREIVLNSLSALLSPFPLQSEYAWSQQLAQAINHFLQESLPDVIHIEHLRMARYGLRFISNWPVIWDAVDYLTALYEQAAHTSISPAWRLISRIEAPRLRVYESFLVSQFPKTLAISKRDCELFQAANRPCASRVNVALLGMPLQSVPAVDRSPNTVILTGTLNYDPNVASVLYFVREIFPMVLRALPETKLQLVGANPIPAVQALQSPNIEVTGFVPSVADYLYRATLAVAPVLYGSGIQCKVLEAFAASTPLVASATALRGLDVSHDQEVWIADTPEDFAHAVITLLKDAGKRAALAQAGRCYVEQNHDLRKTTAHLVELYEEVITSSQRH
jgi:glycosyltransferase involved in cell wall biosynthesis